MRTLRTLKTALLYILLPILLAPATVFALADTENCLMCHKYRYLGRIDEQGKKHNYNVDERIFDHSLHRNVGCRDCHTYITKIPHDPVTEAVNCANVCHITPPFTQEKFSHQRIIGFYNQSVHAVKPDDPPELKKAKPGCKYCHMNPVYTRVSEELIDYHTTLGRCLNCHQEKGVTQAYKHITHRLRKKTSRSPQEIVELCAKCHADKPLMKKLNASEKSLTSVETYFLTIHGKAVRLGSDKTADCIGCHATSAIHDIYKKDNPDSSVNRQHLTETCKQCHEKTNEWFVQVAVHPSYKREENPIIYFANIGLRFAMYGTVFGMVGLLMLETRGRRKDGIRYLLRRGSSWRGRAKTG